MTNSIKKIFLGEFNDQYFAESLDELSEDMASLQQQLLAVGSGNGNISKPFPAYFINYVDDSSLLFFLYPAENENWGLGGTTLFKMRRYDIHSESYTYNDCNPDNQLNHTSTLTISKTQNSLGFLTIFKQQLESKCVRLVGNLVGEIPQDKFKNLDIYESILMGYTTTRFIENS